MVEPSTISNPEGSAALFGAVVCVVGIDYAPDSTGIAPYTTAFARALAEAGADVRVVTGIPHYPQWRVTDQRYLHGRRWSEVIDGIRVIRVRHHVPEVAGLVGRARMEESFLRRALPVVRRTAADAVVAVTPSLAGLVAGVLGRRGAPLGVIVQDITGAGAHESGTTGRMVGGLIGEVELAALRRASLVGVIAPRFGDRLVEHGVAKSRVVDLMNFTHISPSSIDKVSARRRLGWATDGTVALHTGNMGMKQGLEVVVDAARLAEREHVNLQFVLVGDGNQRAELRTRAEGLRNIRFVSPLSAEDYPYALAAADILLLTERRSVREMSMPSKLTSYSASHRPLIASVAREGVTGTFLAERGAALIVDQGDPKELMRGIESLSADPELAAGIAGALSALYAGEYSADAAARRYESFAERLLSVRRSRGGEES